MVVVKGLVAVQGWWESSDGGGIGLWKFKDSGYDVIMASCLN